MKKTVIISEEQLSYLKEAMGGDIGQGFEVPFGAAKKNDPSLDHNEMMKKSAPDYK
jgi:hypothetical protein